MSSPISSCQRLQMDHVFLFRIAWCLTLKILYKNICYFSNWYFLENIFLDNKTPKKEVSILNLKQNLILKNEITEGHWWAMFWEHRFFRREVSKRNLNVYHAFILISLGLSSKLIFCLSVCLSDYWNGRITNSFDWRYIWGVENRRQRFFFLLVSLNSICLPVLVSMSLFSVSPIH